MRTKGVATRATILETAHEVFKAMGYYGSSVSEITRRCDVSMGTFYRYFRNKEQVFLELNDLIISRFLGRAAAIPTKGRTFEARLKEILGLLCDHTRDNLAFHRILGESELIDGVTIAYYESMARYYRGFLRREVQSGHIRPLDPNMVAYGLMGICYFNLVEWGQAGEALPQARLLDTMADFAMRGMSGTRPMKRAKDWPLLPLPAPTPLRHEVRKPFTKGEKTRRAIFEAAERVFGHRGINRANIADITREAGVAPGTFYLYFKSKKDLIEGFVRYINHEMRREIQRRVDGLGDRRDAERVGIQAFFAFLLKHREIYRVVPECEMISREVTRWYYQKTMRGYVQGLEGGIQRGEIRDLPVAFLARSLMGLTHFIGLKWIVWHPGPRAYIPKQIVKDVTDFVLFGLRAP